MPALEIGLLVTCLAVVVGIFGFETLRRYDLNPDRMSPAMLLILRISLGALFILLGIVGSLLPILQGWIFFLLAVLVLFPQSRFAIRALEKAEPRMPRLVARLRRLGIGIPRDTMHSR